MQTSIVVAFALLMVISLSVAAPQQLFNPHVFPTPHIHAAPLPVLRNTFIPVLSRSEVRDNSGQFSLSYRTGDGQTFIEQGALKRNRDDLDYSLAKQGSYSYTSPEGIPIHATYIADENGFRITGNHLPIAPVDPNHKL